MNKLRVSFEFPSRLTGEPTILLGVGDSENIVTPGAVAWYILLRDIDPTTAYYSKTNLNAGVCGTCIHQRFHTCYVTWWRDPQQVWQSHRKGLYPPYDPEHHNRLLAGQDMRFGAAGDPAAVPLTIIRRMHALCCQPALHWDTAPDGQTAKWRKRTGRWLSYTHCHRQKRFRYLRRYCMASVEDEAGLEDARRRGWKPFYTRMQGQPLPPGTFECPKSEAAGHRLNCVQCGACSGGPWKGQATPSIELHGTLDATRHNLEAHLQEKLELIPR